MGLSVSLQHIDEAEGILRNVDGDVGEFVQEKLDAVLAKNCGLAVLRTIATILQNESTTTPEEYNFTAAEIAAFKFAPLVSCDVERSFSRCKAFLRDNRQRFLFCNIVKHMIVHCNVV